MSMRITSDKPSFTGYDARRLNALCMSTPKMKLATELSNIGKNADFDVFIASGKKLLRVENVNRSTFEYGSSFWGQDTSIFTPKKQVLTNDFCDNLPIAIGSHFNRKVLYDNKVPEGGNIYYIQDEDGKNVMLAGKNLLADGIDNMKSLLGVTKIDYIPQMDYHLDLFLRPLDNRRILVADDNLTKKVFRNGLNKMAELLTTHPQYQSELLNIQKNLKTELSKFNKATKENSFSKLENTEKVLIEKGYKPIRVPGRVYHTFPIASDSLIHSLNYMNAIVVKNRKNEMFYITNKSLLDDKIGLTPKIIKQTGFSFENEFKKALADFIPPENIYFVEGEQGEIPQLLEELEGGLHCLVTEIPKF